MDASALSDLIAAWKHRPQGKPCSSEDAEENTVTSQLQPKRSYQQRKLKVRVAVGKACKRFFALADKSSVVRKRTPWAAAVKHFVGEQAMSGICYRKAKSFLQRCVAAADEYVYSGGKQLCAELGTKRCAPSWIIIL